MELASKNINPKIGAIKTEDFNYPLPDGKIAKYPLPGREDSKILVWKNGDISQAVFKNIAEIVPKGSLLVFNNTKVVKARLAFSKESGARIEIFCLEPVNPADYQVSFSQEKQAEWRCIVGNAKKWKSGKLVSKLWFGEQLVLFSAEVAGKEEDSFIIRFEWDGAYSFGEIMEQAGTIPIPPYLNRESEEADKTRYQTVYAKIKGSVAAPTAGLHFTDNILEELHKKGIEAEELTLHVGAGTFRPVKSETIGGHPMHSETVSITLQFLKKLYLHPQKIIAVGTTSVRSLESLYWLGVQISKGNLSESFAHISQWEPYDNNTGLSGKEAVGQIVSYLEKNKLSELNFSTQIIIAPGYTFRLIDGMFTNFHQPQSTLLLLVSAFIGDDWKKVYDFALDNDFRFLSYGDSNFYLK